MSDPTAPVEGTTSAAPETTSTPAAEPWAQVTDRINEIGQTFESRFSELAQRLPQPEVEAEPDPWASLFPEAEPDPYAAQEPQGLDPQALQAAFAQAVQQANAPLQAQIQEMQTRAAHEQLVSRIPQLADTPENAATRAATAQAVQERIASYPPHVQQALMNDAGYIETVFKAAEADKRSQAQVPASEQVPSLEAAGGAVPGGNGEPPSYVQRAHQAAWQLPPGLR